MRASFDYLDISPRQYKLTYVVVRLSCPYCPANKGHNRNPNRKRESRKPKIPLDKTLKV